MHALFTHPHQVYQPSESASSSACHRCHCFWCVLLHNSITRDSKNLNTFAPGSGYPVVVGHVCNSTRDQNHRTRGSQGRGRRSTWLCRLHQKPGGPPVCLQPTTGHSAEPSPSTCVLGPQSRATATPSEPGVLRASVVSPSTLP